MSKLDRTMSFRTALAVVIGGVIGSGIFMKPALIAELLGNPILCLSIWIVAGILTMFGALSNAEVASMFPETGGQFVFFQKMYGESFAFLYGWASFAVFNTAGNASIAYVFAQYVGYFVHLPRLDASIEQAVFFHIPYIGDIFPLKEIGLKGLTILVIIILSAINYWSVNYGAGLQRFLTALKSVAIVLLIGGILFSGKGDVSNFSHQSEPSSVWSLISVYMAALAAAFWAYDGWNNITFIAGEIQDPQRNIPRSLFSGLMFCIIIYFLINVSFAYVLPVDVMAKSQTVAADAATVVWGGIGGSIIALMVVLSVFGSINANILATARVTYALGEGNALFRAANKSHPIYKTPGNAILLNTLWSIILVFSGSFDMLTEMLIFISWFFYGMSALGVFVLRFRMKDTIRPYKVWGYPWVPLIFVAFTFLFLVTTLISDIDAYQTGKAPIVHSLLGICITLVGLPIYYLQKVKANA